MRPSYIATAAIVAASGLSQARVIPANSKRDDDYTNEVVIMLQCDRMQDGSDTLFGTKDQMWWWNDYDAIFVDKAAVTYKTAYVYAPGQDNPTYVDWTAGTTNDPITADFDGEKFKLYGQAETGDSNVSGTQTPGHALVLTATRLMLPERVATEATTSPATTPPSKPSTSPSRTAYSTFATTSTSVRGPAAISPAPRSRFRRAPMMLPRTAATLWTTPVSLRV